MDRKKELKTETGEKERWIATKLKHMEQKWMKTLNIQEPLFYQAKLLKKLIEMLTFHFYWG